METTRSQPDRMLQFFEYAHLPQHLQIISKPFGDLAQWIAANLPSNAERTVSLRKLLEAKAVGIMAILGHRSGVYAIQNIITNAVYIGQSRDVIERFWSHQGKLRQGTHRNSHLQRAWNKYGEDAFVFTVIEHKKDDLLNAELKWADWYQSNGYVLYNLKGCGYGRESVALETRLKISATLKGKKKSPEHVAKISACQIGKIISDQSRSKMSEAHRGVKLPAEQAKKIADANRGRVRSPEARARIRAGIHAARLARS